MNCPNVETLIEIARGGATDTDALRGALAHTRMCARCAERLQRERQLTVSLRGLAAAAPAPPSLEMEARLRAALRPATKGTKVTKDPPAWVAVAASLVVATTAAFWFARDEAPQVDSPPSLLTARAIGAGPPVALAREVVREEAAVAAAHDTWRRATPVRPAQQQPGPAQSTNGEFVALAGAAALPDFESGRIVRIELPVAALPAYGLEMVPDAAPASVEAEFLIGQDGLPRAIRLAATNLTGGSR